MAIKFGNDYMLWVAAPGPTPSYALFGGQQDGGLDSNRQTFDASHKTSGDIALKGGGLRDIVVNLSFICDLPDPGGYTVVETAHKALNGTVLVQIRKGGAGAAPADAVFTCLMRPLQLTANSPLNGALAGSVRFEPAAAPTLDLTLS